MTDNNVANNGNPEQLKIDNLEPLNELIDNLIDSFAQKSPISPEDSYALFAEAIELAGIDAKLSNIVQPPLEVYRIQRLLVNESDRGCVLIGAAYLESELERFFRGYLVDNKGVLDKLFDSNGPLATFDSRITMAFSLGLINHQAFTDLRTIKNIRNKFAHSKEELTLDDERFSQMCETLTHDVVSPKETAPRRRFIRTVIGIAAVLHFAMRIPRIQPKKELDLKNPILIEKSKEVQEALKRVLQNKNNP